MTAYSLKTPDKPANKIKKIIRHILREARWFKVEVLNRNKITRQQNCYFGKSAEVFVPNFMQLGSNISIGSNWLSQTNLNIGDNCLISSRVTFIGNDHDLFDANSTAYFSGRLQASRITLEGDNFIGFGATLLGNITIGKSAIVAAGALVNRDVPPGVIVAGIPAKIIGLRYPD